MEYFVILTVQVRTTSGYMMRTITKAVTVQPGATRDALLEWMLAGFPGSHRQGVIVFFSAEPNDLAVRPLPAPVPASGGKEGQR